MHRAAATCCVSPPRPLHRHPRVERGVGGERPSQHSIEPAKRVAFNSKNTWQSCGGRWSDAPSSMKPEIFLLSSLAARFVRLRSLTPRRRLAESRTGNSCVSSAYPPDDLACSCCQYKSWHSLRPRHRVGGRVFDGLGARIEHRPDPERKGKYQGRSCRSKHPNEKNRSNHDHPDPS